MRSNIAKSRYIQIATGICTMVMFLFTATGQAGATGIVDEINNLAEQTNQINDTFMQETLPLRLKYEYRGRFVNQNDKEKLHKLATKTSNHFQEIGQIQEMLKTKIENYQDDDWDEKFGSTGLWRKLARDLYVTTLSKCQADFYLTLTTESSQKSKTLQDILEKLDSSDENYQSVDSQLLRARASALLAHMNLVYKPAAISRLDSLIAQEDTPQAACFRAKIEKIKLLSQDRPSQLDTLLKELAQSSCADDFELVLALASLRRDLNYPETPEKTLSLIPQTEDVLGPLILSELTDALSKDQKLQYINVFEAQLAADAAWKTGAQNHQMLLEQLSSIEEFQTPLITYVTGLGFVESSPQKAVGFLIKSSNLQKSRKSPELKISGSKIAEQAAQLAYNLFIEDPTNCPVALDALENYCTIAGTQLNEELEYLYCIVLDSCGRTNESIELLKKIAGRSFGDWHNRARLDLIIKTIQQDDYQNRRDELLQDLSNLIANCTEQNEQQIKAEAINISCQLLLEAQDNSSLQKVLTILPDTETSDDLNLVIFKSMALRRLNRPEQAAYWLASALRPERCEMASEAMELLSQIIDKIDLLEEQADDFSAMLDDCQKIARFCKNCLNDRRSSLLLAEINIFTNDKDKLSTAELMLNNLGKNSKDKDPHLLRCWARLLTTQGKFNRAAKFWAELCEITKKQTPSKNQRSANWWRAKYYELYCCSRQPRMKKTNIQHTLDVLENSFDNIPTFWAEKLSSLKQRLEKQI